jgi:ArsR family transcriptional regulator
VAVREEAQRGSEYEEDMRRLESVLAVRMTDSQSFFGRVAGEWDDVRNELFGAGFTSRALLGLLHPSWTVIDAGCGTGNASELLAPHVKRVIAIDESAKMLAAAKKRLSHSNNVEFVRAELDALPVPAGSADAAVCVLVLHHLADPGPALASLRRSLKPGGRLLLVDMLKHDREEYRRSVGHKHLGFSEKDAREMLTRAGLTDIRFVTLPGESDAKGPSLFAATGTAEKAGAGGRSRRR